MLYTSHNQPRRLLALILAACTGLAGCATSFKDSDPAYLIQGPGRPLPDAVPGSARVAVRWIQAITPSAQALLEAHWNGNTFDVLYASSHTPSASDGNPRPYMQIPSDSAYYAAEFSRLLSRRMPQSDIVLEPVSLDAIDGKFIFKPLVRNRFPAQIVVDMWDEPRSYKWDIHGYMALDYSISTSGLASPATCGVLAFKPARNIMPAFDLARCSQVEARDTPHPDLIYGYQSGENTYTLPIPTKPGVPLEPGQAVAFPRTHEAFTPDYLETSASSQFDASRNLANPTLDELSKVVADGLGRIDPALSVRQAWNRYIALYDPALAQRLQAGTPQPADADKLQLIVKLADAERAWISAQDQAVLKNLLDGDFGKSFRATRLAMDKERGKQQMMGWASAIAMMGTMGAAGALGGAGSSMAAMQANLQAMQIAAQSMSNTQQSSDAFYQKFGDEISARQQVIEINYSGTVVKMQADNLDKLYAELGRLYQSHLSTAAPKKTARKK